MWTSSFNKDSTGQDVAEHLKDRIVGKNVLITGCTTGGLGLETALVLAKYSLGCLIITCRTQDKLDEAIKAIKSVNPDVHVKGVIMDLASFASVHKAAEQVNAFSETVNVLINNAALAGVPLDWTEDGNEIHLQVNQLGPFLFTSLLLPKMKTASTPPRVVTVGTGAQAMIPRGIDYTDPNRLSQKAEKGQTIMMLYPSSKSANSLFNSALARKGQGRVEAVWVSPGLILTGLRRHLSDEGKIMMKMNKPDGSLNEEIHSTMDSGVASYILAAFDPKLPKENNGAFIFECQLAGDKVPPFCQGLDNEEKCWAMSEELTKTTFTV